MNENANQTVEQKETSKKAGTLVDVVFDLGITWAAHGLKVAKGALEASGKTLETTAKALERLADELTKKEKEEEKKAA